MTVAQSLIEIRQELRFAGLLPARTRRQDLLILPDRRRRRSRPPQRIRETSQGWEVLIGSSGARGSFCIEQGRFRIIPLAIETLGKGLLHLPGNGSVAGRPLLQQLRKQLLPVLSAAPSLQLGQGADPALLVRAVPIRFFEILERLEGQIVQPRFLEAPADQQKILPVVKGTGAFVRRPEIQVRHRQVIPLGGIRLDEGTGRRRKTPPALFAVTSVGIAVQKSDVTGNRFLMLSELRQGKTLLVEEFFDHREIGVLPQNRFVRRDGVLIIRKPRHDRRNLDSRSCDAEVRHKNRGLLRVERAVVALDNKAEEVQCGGNLPVLGIAVPQRHDRPGDGTLPGIETEVPAKDGDRLLVLACDVVVIAHVEKEVRRDPSQIGPFLAPLAVPEFGVDRLLHAVVAVGHREVRDLCIFSVGLFDQIRDEFLSGLLIFPRPVKHPCGTELRLLTERRGRILRSEIRESRRGLVVEFQFLIGASETVVHQVARIALSLDRKDRFVLLDRFQIFLPVPPAAKEVKTVRRIEQSRFFQARFGGLAFEDLSETGDRLLVSSRAEFLHRRRQCRRRRLRREPRRIRLPFPLARVRHGRAVSGRRRRNLRRSRHDRGFRGRRLFDVPGRLRRLRRRDRFAALPDNVRIGVAVGGRRCAADPPRLFGLPGLRRLFLLPVRRRRLFLPRLVSLRR